MSVVLRKLLQTKRNCCKNSNKLSLNQETSSTVIQSKEKGFWIMFRVSKSKCHLQSFLSMLSKRLKFLPFFNLPNKEMCLCNIPGTSDRSFLVVADWINYYCHLSQYTSWLKKIHCHEVNNHEIPSLLIALFKTLFVPSIFLMLMGNSIFQIHKQNKTKRPQITVSLP